MEAVKIMTGTDVHYFSVTTQLVVTKGIVSEVTGKPTQFVNDKRNMSSQPDRIIFTGAMDNETPCKLLTLVNKESIDSLTIMTDALVYVLGKNGKTIEAIQ